MLEAKTCYYVRLDASDKRYWHWRLAKRDRLDVFHEGRWHVMLAWTDLLTTTTPTAEVALMLRTDYLARETPGPGAGIETSAFTPDRVLL
ncbi:MAG TPA: hypothetical protein VFD39_01085 [Trueperaceae bacterium]|nr:hypothetical protein [Trueperaceae bacterium]